MTSLCRIYTHIEIALSAQRAMSISTLTQRQLTGIINFKTGEVKMRKLICIGMACAFVTIFTAEAETSHDVKDIRIAGDIHAYENKVIKGWEIYKREDGSCYKRTTQFQGVTQLQTSVPGFVVNMPKTAVSDRDVDCGQWGNNLSINAQ